MITPFDKVHYDFLSNLLYEVYDQETRDRIYDFYDEHNIPVWLPRHLGMNNSLEYIIETNVKYLIRLDSKGRFRAWEMK